VKATDTEDTRFCDHKTIAILTLLNQMQLLKFLKSWYSPRVAAVGGIVRVLRNLWLHTAPHGRDGKCSHHATWSPTNVWVVYAWLKQQVLFR